MPLSSKFSRLHTTEAKFVVGGKKGSSGIVEVRLEGSRNMPAPVVLVVPHGPWIGGWRKTRDTRKILLDDDAATEEKQVVSLPYFL